MAAQYFEEFESRPFQESAFGIEMHLPSVIIPLCFEGMCAPLLNSSRNSSWLYASHVFETFLIFNGVQNGLKLDG
jgi:hypothetical protein